MRAIKRKGRPDQKLTLICQLQKRKQTQNPFSFYSLVNSKIVGPMIRHHQETTPRIEIARAKNFTLEVSSIHQF